MTDRFFLHARVAPEGGNVQIPALTFLPAFPL